MLTGDSVDLVLDHIIGKDFTNNLAMIAPFGLIVSLNALGGPPARDLFELMRANLPVSPAVRCFTMHSFDGDRAAQRKIVEKVIALFSARYVSPAIHEILPLAEARRAHEILDARAALGKLVLKPSKDV